MQTVQLSLSPGTSDIPALPPSTPFKTTQIPQNFINPPAQKFHIPRPHTHTGHPPTTHLTPIFTLGLRLLPILRLGCITPGGRHTISACRAVHVRRHSISGGTTILHGGRGSLAHVLLPIIPPARRGTTPPAVPPTTATTTTASHLTNIPGASPTPTPTSVPTATAAAAPPTIPSLGNHLFKELRDFLLGFGEDVQ
eukprot:comp23824_c0_seq1/m.41536 comp23824_c0_seq1/g.41536  ORF comp23824_c0_seq1/g.41536 comp23824_c0_seq1/m.41536 type:complete len:196 (+) comp23824_c0_seq1:638-1225(+)